MFLPLFINLILFVVLLMLEMFAPANFFFLSLAFSFLFAGFLDWFLVLNLFFLPVWLIIFGSTFFAFTRYLRRAGLSRIDSNATESAALGIPGQVCKVISLRMDGDLIVLLEKEQWVASSQNGEEILPGEKVIVVRVVGNRLIVKKI